jgi:GntR family transcriptional regulator
MEPEPTSVTPPIQLRIADSIRMQIQRGDLPPGQAIPTLQQLSQQWDCSINSARSAVVLLKQQGLITGGRGRAPVVRTPPRRLARSNERHLIEKGLVRRSEDERRSLGSAEIDMGVPLAELEFTANFEQVDADESLAAAFGLPTGIRLLQRTYQTSDPGTDRRESWSVSWLPLDLISQNPDLLDPSREPWPGGTQHQLYTVGIEIARIIDEVSAEAPTTVDVHRWQLSEGVPLLRVRRTSVDAQDRIVEVSDAVFPADRTTMRFTTALPAW